MLRALVLFLLVASRLAAQDAPHVGRWKLSFHAGERREGGAVTPISGTGILTVERTGDSLIATLVSDPIADAPSRPPARMAAGVSSAPEATFTSNSTGTMTANGEERPFVATSIWKLRVKGDSLVGTVERRGQVPGMPPLTQEPHPVSGVRVK